MTETKPCPECDKFIPVSAVKCRCGWTAPQGKDSYIACAFAGCPRSAMIHTKTKTGWANVCIEHDLVLVQKSADAYCKALGLNTTAEKRAYVLQMVRGMKRKFTPPDLKSDEQFEREAESIPF